MDAASGGPAAGLHAFIYLPSNRDELRHLSLPPATSGFLFLAWQQNEFNMTAVRPHPVTSTTWIQRDPHRHHQHTIQLHDDIRDCLDSDSIIVAVTLPANLRARDIRPSSSHEWSRVATEFPRPPSTVRAAPARWICANVQTAYAEGSSLLQTPHLSLAPTPANPRARPYDIPPSVYLQVGRLMGCCVEWQREEGARLTVFGREAFYEAWPASAPFLTRFVNLVLRARSSIDVVSHLQTGERPSLQFVRIDHAPDLIVAKIYDFYFDPGEAVLTNPIVYTRSLCEMDTASSSDSTNPPQRSITDPLSHGSLAGQPMSRSCNTPPELHCVSYRKTRRRLTVFWRPAR